MEIYWWQGGLHLHPNDKEGPEDREFLKKLYSLMGGKRLDDYQPSKPGDGSFVPSSFLSIA